MLSPVPCSTSRYQYLKYRYHSTPWTYRVQFYRYSTGYSEVYYSAFLQLPKHINCTYGTSTNSPPRTLELYTGLYFSISAGHVVYRVPVPYSRYRTRYRTHRHRLKDKYYDTARTVPGALFTLGTEGTGHRNVLKGTQYRSQIRYPWIQQYAKAQSQKGNLFTTTTDFSMSFFGLMKSTSGGPFETVKHPYTYPTNSQKLNTGTSSNLNQCRHYW
jgi:hypothetical protein